MNRWPWRLSAITGAALLAPVLLVSDGPWLELLIIIAACGAFLASVVALRLHPMEYRGAHRLLQFALGGFAASTLLDFEPLGLTAPHPVAKLGLALYAGSFVAIGAAMFRLAEHRLGGRDTEGRIDTALVSVAAAAVLHDLAIAPALAATTDPTTRVVFSVLPLLLAPVVAAAARLLITGAHRLAAAWFFFAAAIAGLGGTILSVMWVASGSSTRFTSVLWLAAYACLACGSLHPSSAQLGEANPPAGTRQSLGRLTVIGTALMSLPVTMLLADGDGSGVSALAAIICVALVLWRASRLLLERERANHELRHHAQQQGALSAIGHAAVASEDAESFVVELTTAIDTALGTTSTRTPDTTPGDDLRERLLPLDDRLGALRVRFADAASARDDGPFLRIASDLAGAALRRWRAEELLRHHALHDALTGLPNRALICKKLEQALHGTRTTGAPLALLFVDLDGFKAVNDTLGHAAGDQVLGEVAERLCQRVRPTDVVGRLAGDEFVVVCEALPTAEATAQAHRILDAIAAPFALDLGDAVIGSSIGLAIAGPDETPESLLHRADAAMYHAKRRGKGRVELFDELPDEALTAAPATAR